MLPQEIVRELERYKYDFHIDGEMVHLDSSLTCEAAFSKLCSRMRTKYQTPEMATDIPLTYVVFDVLSFDGMDCRENMDRRKEILPLILGYMNNVIESYVYHNLFQQVYDRIISGGGEGVIVKKRGTTYQNKRSKDWLKIIPKYTMDVKCTGYTKGTGRRESTFGALRCSTAIGKEFNVGTGFTDKLLAEIKQNIDSSVYPEEFIIEIGYKGIHPSSVPRMPTFKRIRLDKTVPNTIEEIPIIEKEQKKEQKSLFDF